MLNRLESSDVQPKFQHTMNEAIRDTVCRGLSRGNSKDIDGLRLEYIVWLQKSQHSSVAYAQ